MTHKVNSTYCCEKKIEDSGEEYYTADAHFYYLNKQQRDAVIIEFKRLKDLFDAENRLNFPEKECRGSY